LKNVPTLLFFSPYSEEPINYSHRYDFQTLHWFINTEIPKELAKKEKNDKNVNSEL
jgi:hypothetical protein